MIYLRAADLPAEPAGRRFAALLGGDRILPIPGAHGGLAALQAREAGFRAVYLSGAAMSASMGLPDLGVLTIDDVCFFVRQVARASGLPVLVDGDTGYGEALNVMHMVRSFEEAGAAAVHIEDQVAQKRCGHRPGKAIVPVDEMLDRIKAAVDAKTDPDFVVMARTDALAVDGFDAVIDRVVAFEAAGADAIFAEAMTDLDLYRRVVRAVRIPVLANITEFGQTPLYTTAELGSAGIAMALYPLSAFRAMSAAALEVYRTIRRDGTQKAVVASMQTRADLYECLGYHDYERKLDELFAKETA